MPLCAVQPRAMGGRSQQAQAARSQAPPAAAAPRRGPASVRAFFGNKAGANSTASNAQAQETLVPDGAIKSLSPEARRIFREAQDNIIELNKSRLRALEELKSARQKISELEGQLEQAVAEASQATAQLQQLGGGGGPAAAAYAQQPPAAAAASGRTGTITVVYETGWGSAFVHHNTDGRGWTSVPGTKMQNGSQQFPDKKVLTVAGSRMEFVINDGGSDWDKPGPEARSSNYTITEPGTYRIKHGRVTRLA